MTTNRITSLQELLHSRNFKKHGVQLSWVLKVYIIEKRCEERIRVRELTLGYGPRYTYEYLAL